MPCLTATGAGPRIAALIEQWLAGRSADVSPTRSGIVTLRGT